MGSRSKQRSRIWGLLIERFGWLYCNWLLNGVGEYLANPGDEINLPLVIGSTNHGGVIAFESYTGELPCLNILVIGYHKEKNGVLFWNKGIEDRFWGDFVVSTSIFDRIFLKLWSLAYHIRKAANPCTSYLRRESRESYMPRSGEWGNNKLVLHQWMHENVPALTVDVAAMVDADRCWIVRSSAKSYLYPRVLNVPHRSSWKSEGVSNPPDIWFKRGNQISTRTRNDGSPWWCLLTRPLYCAWVRNIMQLLY